MLPLLFLFCFYLTGGPHRSLLHSRLGNPRRLLRSRLGNPLGSPLGNQLLSHPPFPRRNPSVSRRGNPHRKCRIMLLVIVLLCLRRRRKALPVQTRPARRSLNSKLL